MYQITKPLWNYEQFYKNCLPKKETKNKIEATNIQKEALEKGLDYDKKASKLNFSAISQNENGKILIAIYKGITQKNSNRRKHYDSILSLSNGGLCPFCSHGSVTTIDHFLPKEKYPIYAILPYNLIPCCSDCNKNKGSLSPKGLEEQFIHPYYEKVDDVRWLHAICKYRDGGYILDFYVKKTVLSKEREERFKYSFNTLKLSRLYTLQASREINVIMQTVKKIFDNSPSDKKAVRKELINEAKKYSINGKNTWQVAMYYALSENENFCNCCNFNVN